MKDMQYRYHNSKDKRRRCQIAILARILNVHVRKKYSEKRRNRSDQWYIPARTLHVVPDAGETNEGDPIGTACRMVRIGSQIAWLSSLWMILT
jgi:hypothetical protein